MKIVAVIATRPDVIKMAPVIHALRRHRTARVRVVLTSQHRELVTPLLKFFDIPVHYDLKVMIPGQTLTHVTTAVLTRLETVLIREKPDVVLVQGDTTSACAAALSAFYQRIPVGHVEAGLRTYDMNHPYPEEANRRLVGTLAHWHFAPTRLAREHLLGEHVARAQIYVTGNTVVDALRFAITKQKKKLTSLQKKYGLAGRPSIIITCHRRENHGPPLQQICAAIREVAGRHPECDYLIPLHPNPAVGVKMRAALCDLPCVKLLQPLDYPEFVLLMARCLFIVTDSGGIQEEAPSIGKPVLILRERTERPEVVQVGVAKLIGTRREVVAQHMLQLIEQPAARKRMSHARSLFGDGQAGKRIARVLLSTGRDHGVV